MPTRLTIRRSNDLHFDLRDNAMMDVVPPDGRAFGLLMTLFLTETTAAAESGLTKEPIALSCLADVFEHANAMDRLEGVTAPHGITIGELGSGRLMGLADRRGAWKGQYA